MRYSHPISNVFIELYSHHSIELYSHSPPLSFPPQLCLFPLLTVTKPPSLVALPAGPARERSPDLCTMYSRFPFRSSCGFMPVWCSATRDLVAEVVKQLCPTNNDGSPLRGAPVVGAKGGGEGLSCVSLQ
jgi:hypothetical protein